MKMGDDIAKSLGGSGRVRTVTLVAACISTATVVIFTGAIASYAYLRHTPLSCLHRGDERLLIVASSLFGANLLLVADIIARRIIAPIMLPVGALTAFLGGPLLLYLLIRRKVSY